MKMRSFIKEPTSCSTYAENKGDYFGINEVQLGLAESESMVEVDVKPLDEFKVERCTVALSRPESVSS
jgi:hypothetical protein